MTYKYPMWVKNIYTGKVTISDIHQYVSYECSDWIGHTNTNNWENITDQYKGKHMGNSPIEINTTHTPMEELQQIILNGKTYNLIPVEETKPEEPTIKKWEPKGGEWFIDSDGAVRTGDSVDSYRLYGIERETIEQAQKASIEIRKHNRLLAWLSENDDGWTANWSENDDKCYVGYDHRSDKYKVYVDWRKEMSSVVYMSKDNAHKLADLLNKGIVEL